MITLKRILVPIDFSEFSKVALPYGRELADRFAAELHLLHVVQYLYDVIPEPGFVFSAQGDQQAQFMAEQRASAERGLAQLIEPGWESQHRVVRATSEGAPFLEIIRYAKEHEIDLIVIGTHGRGGLAHVLLGSVAERVVRKAPCPVLTVRSNQHQFVMP